MTRISGSVLIDLRFSDEHESKTDFDHAVTRLIQSGSLAPMGADVVLVVDPRAWPSYLGVGYLREHGQHLGSITVQCSDPDTIKVWCAALRGEAP